MKQVDPDDAIAFAHSLRLRMAEDYVAKEYPNCHPIRRDDLIKVWIAGHQAAETSALRLIEHEVDRMRASLAYWTGRPRMHVAQKPSDDGGAERHEPVSFTITMFPRTFTYCDACHDSVEFNLELAKNVRAAGGVILCSGCRPVPAADAPANPLD